MSDLYDLAKPVRDATLVEMERLLATDPDLPDYIKDGYRLGVHLASLMMTATARRLGGLSGAIESAGLLDYATIAIAQAISYTATGFRPMRNGKPITPLDNLDGVFDLLVAHTFKQVQMAQAGAQDFTIPFRLNNGVMEKVEFDFADLLKGERKP